MEFFFFVVTLMYLIKAGNWNSNVLLFVLDDILLPLKPFVFLPNKRKKKMGRSWISNLKNFSKTERKTTQVFETELKLGMKRRGGEREEGEKMDRD